MNKIFLGVIFAVLLTTILISHEANATPFNIELFRGDVNQSSLTSFFSQMNIGNFAMVYPTGRASPNDYKALGNYYLITVNHYASVNSSINAALKNNQKYLVYDLEPGSGQEFYDYVNSVQKVSNAAHNAGLKLVLVPRWLEVPSYAEQVAPFVDMMTIQLPYPPNSLKNYTGWVENYSSLVKSANPDILVGEQLLTKPQGNHRINNFDPSDIALEYNNTKQFIDYDQLFYFNCTYANEDNTTITGDVIPYLDKFYTEIGMLQ